MRLRRQLLIVSLFILYLPWAGCQYIREMENVLRDGQIDALKATTQAIATSLKSEGSLIKPEKYSRLIEGEQQLYFHPLSSPAIVDGFNDDWRAFNISPLHFPSSQNATANTTLNTTVDPSQSSLEIYTGKLTNTLYFFLEVRDKSEDWHNPQKAVIASGDHVILNTLHNEKIISYFIRTSGPGSFTARHINDSGDIRQEHQIRGQWRQTRNGYAIEFQAPERVIGDYLDITYVDTGIISSDDLSNDPGGFNLSLDETETFFPITNYDKATLLGTGKSNSKPKPWASAVPSLKTTLKPYSNGGQVISVIDKQQWLLAQTGDLPEQTTIVTRDNISDLILEKIYRVVLGDQNFPVYKNSRIDGRLDGLEIKSALGGSTGANWYQKNTQGIGRVASPIIINGEVVGAVTIEESTNSLVAGTNSAFNRLFFYTVLGIAIVGFVLLAYASLLSYRIRRLSHAADNAIGDDGKIRSDFINSTSRDEIGDLTRSYAKLLSRLRDYTDYLRTLSNKLSHELRTPLAVVRSSLENLEHETLTDEAAEYISRARDGSNRLANILNAMNAANRIEESIEQAQAEQFPLDELLAELCNAYQDTYQGVNISLQKNKHEAGFLTRGSPDLIVQMLDKLIDNAADFCPKDGNIKLTLSRSKQDLYLCVSNDGPPLPEHMQGQLFDSLVSIRNGKEAPTESSKLVKPKDNGTHLGLGLYIVRLIVDFHGGHVSAQNREEGGGVEFHIRLPATL